MKWPTQLHLLILQKGREDICKVMNQYGHGKGTTQGGFSEYSVVKAKYCYPLKTDISYIDAVLLGMFLVLVSMYILYNFIKNIFFSPTFRANG